MPGSTHVHGQLAEGCQQRSDPCDTTTPGAFATQAEIDADLAHRVHLWTVKRYCVTLRREYC